MPDGLYERDVLTWSERQAALLRRLAAGERVNDAVDWANVIDEVEAVGLSELRSCTSLLRMALVHLLKLRAWPDSHAAAHWGEEVEGFLLDASDRYAPSMRHRIDLQRLYDDALYRVRGKRDDSGPPRAVRAECPFELDELVATRPSVEALVARLA